MKNTPQENRPLSEVDVVDLAEKDLILSRTEKRFDDSLDHLDEIYVIQIHTRDEQLKARCEQLLGHEAA
jgi:hypothetical protein